MNKKILKIVGLSLVPAGALFLNACGPDESMINQELALDEASDNYVMPGGRVSEYGRCNDTQDNDGDGRADSYDPDCHNIGPLRDLSVQNFPIGHNFAPDLSKIPAGGPGAPGGFRNRAQITRWFRFLTEADGGTAGITLLAPGVNHNVVPVPAPLGVKAMQGSYASGNNNNVDTRLLFDDSLEAVAPATGNASTEYNKGLLPAPWYNSFATGLGYKGGSQNAYFPAKTGNPDVTELYR